MSIARGVPGDGTESTGGTGRPADGGGTRRQRSAKSEDTAPRRRTRREREYLRHREEVMAAAERLLEVKDYRDLTVQDIANEAEFSVGYLYKLFSSKDDIFATIVRLRHRQALELVQAVVNANQPPEVRLHRLIVELFDWLGQNVSYNALTFRSLQSLVLTDAQLQAAIVAVRDEIEEALAVLCADAIAAGLLAAPDPRLIARTLRAVFTGFIKEEILDVSFSSASRPRLEHAKIAALIERIILLTFAPETTDAKKR